MGPSPFLPILNLAISPSPYLPILLDPPPHPADKHLMRVYLDDAMCDVETASIPQALAGAAVVARERGRAIVDVVIDGRQFAAEALDQERLATANAKEIHLTTADCAQLVRQAFDDAGVALAEADRLQQTAAELLQADRVIDAMQRLGEALAIWSNVRAAVLMGAEMAGLDATSGEGGATIAGLSERLQSLRTALQQQPADPVALADTLMYDLPEVITAWRAMLCDLRQRVADND
jgi:hypothetical protein